VDIGAALKAAIEEGLVKEHGSSKVYKFAHDMIAEVRSLSKAISFFFVPHQSNMPGYFVLLKQTVFDLIPRDERSMLLKKLVSVLLRNAEDIGEIDENVYVVVDLINRFPKEEVTEPAQRVLYASMNEKAGKYMGLLDCCKS
jgi:hypothetical protein